MTNLKRNNFVFIEKYIMKLLATFIFFLFIYNLIHAQKWGKNTFGQFTNEALDIEIDNAGNSYVTGYITGETAFGTNNIFPSAVGNGDIYVAKYSEAGSLQWVKKFGGNYSDRAYDLAIGPDQNIVVTGQFFGSVTFGSTTLQSAANSKDIFLVKIDPFGDVIWARKEGGNMSENAFGVTVDHQNNVILTGQFQGTSSIANQTFSSVIDPVTNAVSFDFFISKYDASGNPIWAKVGAAKKEDRGLAVAVDSQDNIFLTGQYSDTLSFGGNVYNNNGFNVGFVSKISPTGQVLFFNNLRAGFVLPYDIEVNTQNQPILSGDFMGNMNYYHNGIAHPIQNQYSKKIFVLKIENNGSYDWHYTLGSDSDLSCRSISIDPADGVFVTGFFTCALSQLHNSTTAYWNSVGFKDPYILKLSNSGNFQYAKQIGGKLDDEGHGIAVKSTDKPVLCGSFTQDLNVPYSPTASVVLGNTNYQLNEYNGEAIHYFLKGDSTRNSFLLKYIDGNTVDYNYFNVPTQDSLVGFIANGEDTLHFCDSISINYTTLTWDHYGPSYLFEWSNSDSTLYTYISTTGDYSVEVTRNDGCSFDMDSIHLISDPVPQLPLLSDDVIQYTNQAVDPFKKYGEYAFCFPDTISVFYTNLEPGTTMFVVEPNNNNISGVGPMNHFQEGNYWVNVDNGMCINQGHFNIDFDYAPLQDSLSLGISSTSNFVNDSIQICAYDWVQFFAFDSITNPSAMFETIHQPFVTTSFTINGIQYESIDTNDVLFQPGSTGNYLVEFDAIVGYDNLCGVDTTLYHVEKMYFIEVLPAPAFSGVISGDNDLCENGSIFLTVSNTNPNLSWSGPGISWTSSSGDSIEINAPGIYSYSGAVVHPVTGCEKAVQLFTEITLKQAPNIVSNPEDGIVCPYDTAFLTVPSIYQTYQWIGPEGDTVSSISSCNGTIQGFYYCHVLDNEGCYLTTPPFELKEYTTPTVTIFPQDFLCSNESVTISVNYSGEPIFQWSPATSSSDEIVVSQPGTYSVTIQQCGITLIESVTINDASFDPVITSSSPNLCAGSPLTITGTPLNLNYTWSNGESNTGTLTVQEAGTYSAVVTNEYGCVEETNSVTINLVANSIQPTMDSLVVCIGTDVLLADSSGFSLNWYDLDSNFIQTTSNVQLPNIQSDTAFIVAYQNLDCPLNFKTVIVDVVDSISDFSLIADTTMCDNEIITIVLDHSPAATFEWFNGNTTSSEIQVSQPGIYHVSIQECGLEATASIQIFDGSFTALLTVSDSIICASQTAILTAIPIVNTTISWNNSNETNNPLEVNQGGIYVATITNEFGCQSVSDTIEIYEDTVSFTPFVGDLIVCSGSDAVLQDPSGQELNWYTSDSVFITSAVSLFLSGLTNDTSFIYSQLSDACEVIFQTVLVDVIDSISDFSILGDSLLCPTEVTTFSVNTAENVVWIVGGQTIGNENSIEINPGNIGFQPIISATVSNQCFSVTITDSIFYANPETISLEDYTLTICSYENVPVALNEDVLSVTWWGNFGVDNSTVLVLNSSIHQGTISVNAIDLNGCQTNTLNLYLTVSDLEYSVHVTGNNVCEDQLGFLILTTNTDNFEWSTPIGSFDTTVISYVSNPNVAGNYELTLWDDVGCRYDTSFYVPFNPLPVFDLGTDTLMCMDDVFTFVFPSESVSYTWLFFGSTQDVPIAESQEMILIATSAAGCSFMDTIYVMAVNCSDELPNVMTPNGDGINDYFVIDEAIAFPNNQLIIQNRWGNVVYHENGYRNNFDGLGLNDGVYFYVFYPDANKRDQSVKQGYLTIIR